MRLGLQPGPLDSWSTQCRAFNDLGPFVSWRSRVPNKALDNPTQLTFGNNLMPVSVPAGRVAVALLENMAQGFYTISHDGELNPSKPRLLSGETLSVAADGLVAFEFTKLPTRLSIAQSVETAGSLTWAAANQLMSFRRGCLRFMVAQGLNNSNPHEFALHHKQAATMWQATGLPVNVMMDMCDSLHMDPWFCVSPMATDDEVRAFLAEVVKYVKPWMTVTLEHGNEIWNGIYPWSKHIKVKTGATDWAGVMKYHHDRTVWIAKEAYSILGDNCRVVLGCQCASIGTFPNEYFDSTWIKGIAIAPYFGYELRTFDGTVDALFDALPESIALQDDQLTRWRIEADAFGVALVAYESGQHLQSSVKASATPAEKAAHDAREQVFRDANQDVRMAGVYRTYLDMLDGHFGVDEDVVLHCWCKKQSSGNFGLVENIGDSSPKMEAAQWFMSASNTPRVWTERAGKLLGSGDTAQAGAALVRAAECMA